MWEIRKQKLYGEDTCPSHHQCQTLVRDARPVTGGGGLRVSKMGNLQIWVSWVSFLYIPVYSGKVHASDCVSAHCGGCMVNGISAKTVA